MWGRRGHAGSRAMAHGTGGMWIILGKKIVQTNLKYQRWAKKAHMSRRRGRAGSRVMAHGALGYVDNFGKK